MDKTKLRMFAGEFKEGKVEVLYPKNPEGFNEGDFVVVLHGDDYLTLTESFGYLKKAIEKEE